MTAVPGLATATLWRRLARPFDLAEVAEALLGIPGVVAGALADISISAGVEANDLLASMPKLLRRLRMSSRRQAERSASGIRGPVLWSETVAAWSSSLGQSTVYVCSVAGRDFDVMENRMLVESLRAVARSGERVQVAVGAAGTSDASTAMAKANADAATRYIGHRAFAQVGSFERKGRRPWRSLATGRNASAYRPAVALLDKAADPVDLHTLVKLSAPGTDVQHRFLMATIEALECGGHRVPPVRTEAGAVIVGPFDYLHPHSGSTGDLKVGLLRGRDLVLAFDPTGAGTANVDKARVGSRKLISVTNTHEVADFVGQLAN